MFFSAAAMSGQEIDKANGYSIETVYNDNKVKFTSLKVVQTDAGLFIKGTITRRTSSTSVAPGHIDVLVSSADGEVLLDTTAQYCPAHLLRYTHCIGQRGSSFTVQLPESLPKDASIRVSYHRNSIDKNMSSPRGQHEENILLQGDPQ
jgi:hypothetical protein